MIAGADTRRCRILSIAFTSGLCAFVVSNGDEDLISWGTRRIDMNNSDLGRETVLRILKHYNPNHVVLPITSDLHPKTNLVIKKIIVALRLYAESEMIRVTAISTHDLATQLDLNTKRGKLTIAQKTLSRYPKLASCFLDSQTLLAQQKAKISTLVALAMSVTAAHLIQPPAPRRDKPPEQAK